MVENPLNKDPQNFQDIYGKYQEKQPTDNPHKSTMVPSIVKGYVKR
jgi:hypothetical protein